MYCSLRNSEIGVLTTNDIDFKNNTINVIKQISKERRPEEL